jgi:hypothetical protein
MTARRPVLEIIDEMTVDVLREKTPAERLEIASGMWESARVMLRGAIRQEHPDWSDEAILREIARRISHGKVNHAGE